MSVRRAELEAIDDLDLLVLAELTEDAHELERRTIAALLELRALALEAAEAPVLGHFTQLRLLEALDAEGVLWGERLAPEAARVRLSLLEALEALLERLARGGYLCCVYRGFAWPKELGYRFTRAALLGELLPADALHSAAGPGPEESAPGPRSSESDGGPGAASPPGAWPAWVHDALRDEPPLLRSQRVAELLDISPRHLRRLLTRGELVTLRREGSGSKVLVPRHELGRYLAALGTPAAGA